MNPLDQNQHRRKHSSKVRLEWSNRRKSVVVIGRQMTLGSFDTLKESYHWVIKRGTCLLEK